MSARAWWILLGICAAACAATIAATPGHPVDVASVPLIPGVIAAITMWSVGLYGNITLTDDTLRVGRHRLRVTDMHPYGVVPVGERVDGQIMGGAYGSTLGTNIVGIQRHDGTTALVETRDPDALRAALQQVLAPHQAPFHPPSAPAPAPDRHRAAASTAHRDDPGAAERPSPAADAAAGVDLWAPLGSAGSTVVEDLLRRGFHLGSTGRVPYLHRADVQVGDVPLRLAWWQRTLAAAVLHGDDEREVARGRSERGTGPQNLVWGYSLMPLDMGGATIHVERRRRGPERWALDVTGPDGRAWTWHPAGRVFAHRTELTRAGDRRPVVTHQLRPIPGAPRSPAGPPTVTWRDDATLAEVLMPVMWTLDRVYDGILPKAQRLARFDVL
ncbi:hypothetical protein [Cellulomonas oligotrophica]|uniref:DUF304 domain-containing protein n=1 Tax=Cellulomonas oligotrophica TaxID=931536 RepID=A0A7Y9JYP1_9CELL|nr:hypothetical protein [Cellulomonas oligotrophica]